MDEQAKISFLANLTVKDKDAMPFGFSFTLMLLLDLEGTVYCGGTPYGLELLEAVIFLHHLLVFVFVYPTENALVFSLFYPIENGLDDLCPLRPICPMPNPVAAVKFTGMKFIHAPTGSF